MKIKDLSPEELIGIMDELIACLVCKVMYLFLPFFIHSVSQSVWYSASQLG